MAPTIHLVRHAEATHNISSEHVVHPDTRLTLLGRMQADHIATTFPEIWKVTHLVSSPSDRTIETCVRGFGAAVLDTALVSRITLHPDLQEVGHHNCNYPSKLGWLVLRWGRHVDTSLLGPGWDDRRPGSLCDDADPANLASREVRARSWLHELAKSAVAGGEENPHIVVVSHQNFLNLLTRGNPYSLFWNAEFRSYQFGLHEDPTWGPWLVETEESLDRRTPDT